MYYHSNEEYRQKSIIRAMTKKRYPIKNQKCGICGINKAIEHHHFKSYAVESFIYICKQCHIIQHTKINGGGLK